MEFLVDLQRWIDGAVSDELTAFEATRNIALLFGILPLGIALGAVHALHRVTARWFWHPTSPGPGPAWRAA